MRAQFLAGAAVVLTAVSDARVASRWDEPSILAQQSIGSLCGHLARGSVWAVEEYLDGADPTAPPDFETAADYFASVAGLATDEMHQGVRDRGAAIASTGPDAVVEKLGSSVTRLSERLLAEPSDRTVAVIAGMVMRLDDYLLTRIVEQVVHLDDLSRSLGVGPWENPPHADALVIACGAEIGRQRFGGPAMIRAMFREDATTLPVI